MRYELKRFVYMCDGWEQANNHCSGTQVIDAVDQRAADGIAKDRGWKFDTKTGALLCGSRDHVRGSEKLGNPQQRRRRDQENCKHNPVRINDIFYICTKCGKGGSQQWADKCVDLAS